ncbi:MAG: hypothetical protein Tsb0027_17890 [Wenzhouxiangellaceae bacterium]
MQGGLGPLQELGLHGTMIWSLAASSERETVVHWKYFVAGVSDADLLALAPVVDAVLGGQIDRLAAQFSSAAEHLCCRMTARQAAGSSVFSDFKFSQQSLLAS